MDQTCINDAKTAFDEINIPESERRERATDKVVEANGALTELRAVVTILEKQDEDLEAHVALLRSECASVGGLTVYLAGVRGLILNAAECPGVKETTLVVPTTTCKTDGSGLCSWTCSSRGQVFATGGYYASFP